MRTLVTDEYRIMIGRDYLGTASVHLNCLSALILLRQRGHRAKDTLSTLLGEMNFDSAEVGLEGYLP